MNRKDSASAPMCHFLQPPLCGTHDKKAAVPREPILGSVAQICWRGDKDSEWEVIAVSRVLGPENGSKGKKKIQMTTNPIHISWPTCQAAISILKEMKRGAF